MSRVNKTKAHSFFGGRGFYIALVLCLTVAGVVGWQVLNHQAGVAEDVVSPAPVVQQPVQAAIPEPEPEPEKDTAFPVGNLLMVAAVALVGGGAAYYFKVYRPKHEAAGLDEDDYDYDEADPYGDMETEEETEDEE